MPLILASIWKETYELAFGKVVRSKLPEQLSHSFGKAV